MSKRTTSTLFLALLVGVATAQAPATAQTFPDKFVKVIINVPPGGLQDQLARALASELSTIWKHPVVVESRPGGGGVLATEAVRQSRADGYTILQMDSTSIFTNAHLREKKAPYDFEKVMVPLRSIVISKSVFVASPKFEAKNVAEFVALAKASPGKINYGSFGTGTIVHVDMEAMAATAGIKLTHVPYKGGNALAHALVAGEVSVGLLGVTSAVALVREGRLKAFAFLADERSPLFPGVPTLKEAGVPFTETSSWVGWWVPAGTPANVIDKISQDIDTALKTDSFEKAIEPFGLKVLNEPSAVLKERVVSESKLFEQRILPLAIKLDE